LETAALCDQRGSGKTHDENEPTEVEPLTMARLMDDAKSAIAHDRRIADLT